MMIMARKGVQRVLDILIYFKTIVEVELFTELAV
jgi:hypothetical protein